MAKKFGKNPKKTPRKSHKLKAKKLAAINAKSLSKAQKRHLKDFGELHPINSSFGANDGKNVKRIEDVEEDEEYIVQKFNVPSSSLGSYEDGQDTFEEEKNAYQQLIGSLGKKSSTLQFASSLMDEKEELDDSDDSMGDSDDDDDINGDQLDVDTVENTDVEKENDIEEGADGEIIDKENKKDDSKSNKNLDDIQNDDGDDDDDDDYRQPVENLDDGDDNEHQNEQDEQDPFTVHFEQDLNDSVVTKLDEKSSLKQSTVLIQSFGTVTTSEPTCNVPIVKNTNKGPALFKVKEKLCTSWMKLNQHNETFSPIQSHLFGYVNKYQDVFYTERNFDNCEDIRKLYCLHTVNHILKTRSRVLKNNAKIIQAQKDNKDLEDLRDQGLTRPKVLILVPFRDSALKIVNVIIDLLITDSKGQVMNKKRFMEDYYDSSDTSASKRSFRPDDFDKMFAGNIDDCFRFGLSIKKNTVKLYSRFYASDVIIASPLGLRTVIGTEGETFGDFDFLSSIEVLIVDQMDVFLMQNWEHMKHIFDHLHRQPKSSHDVDFSRVRNWCLNGWSKYYRQTLLFTSFVSPEQNFLYNKYCHNFAGKVKIQVGNIPGSICQVVTQVPQVFHRVQCTSFNEASEKRFEYFTDKILTEFRGQESSFTAIFVPSYFDFVRLRNFFRKEEIPFLHISEYSTRSDITRTRNWFKDGKKPFLLYTERFYFYYRYRIKGIRNIIFYGLPHYAHFYPEILNFLDTSHESTATTCSVMYTKYDNHRLANVVGSKRCAHMISSRKHVHMFVTGEKSDES